MHSSSQKFYYGFLIFFCNFFNFTKIHHISSFLKRKFYQYFNKITQDAFIFKIPHLFQIGNSRTEFFWIPNFLSMKILYGIMIKKAWNVLYLKSYIENPKYSTVAISQVIDWNSIFRLSILWLMLLQYTSSIAQ